MVNIGYMKHATTFLRFQNSKTITLL
jgi:hypothetical protein